MTEGWYTHVMIRAEMESACVAACDALMYGHVEESTVSVKSGKSTRKVAKKEKFPGLLAQLRWRSSDPFASKQGGPSNNPNKSVSRPPVNQAMLDLVDSIDEQCERMVTWLRNRITVVQAPPRAQFRSPEGKLSEIRVMCGSSMLKDAEVAQVLQSLTQMVSRCREMLGHDARRVMLADMVCHECGGALSVAQDASTDVECIGKPNKEACGNTYARHEWLSLMKQEEA